MDRSRIPQGYTPLLNIYETQKAIGLLHRLFEDRLSGALRLHRVSAPLFVAKSSGLNDDLNGVERPVAFDIRGVSDTAVVVHSLAKWKRLALKRYQFHPGEGLYTDMNAIRRDEDLDNLHSAYVDQWDWEKIITAEDRNLDYLKNTVRAIVGALRDTQAFLRSVFPQLSVLPELPGEVTFGGPVPRLHRQGAGERLCPGASRLLPHRHRRQAALRQAPRRPRPRL